MSRRRHTLRLLVLVSLGPAAVLAFPLAAQTATEELIAQEQLRESVEAVMQDHLSPASDGEVRIDRAIRAVERLVAMGPGAVPHLINDLEQESPETFDFCAYALGQLGTPEAEAALREAIDRAEDQGGAWARTRKAWAAWSLGLMGRADAIVALGEGKLAASTYAIHSNMSVTESIALQTAPESVPLLLGQLARYREGQEGWQERQTILRALAWAGDPSVIPSVLPFLEHEDHVARREASNTVGALGTQRELAALARGLDDPEFIVRRAFGLAMERIGPPAMKREILERLEVETDGHARATLYRMLAWESSEEVFLILNRERGRADLNDRRGLVQAVSMLQPARMDFLKEMLRDSEPAVALEAALALVRLGGPAASEILIGAFGPADWNVAQALTTQLTKLGGERAAGAIAERLLGHLAKPIEDDQAIFPLETMARALVDLRHVESLPALGQALEIQKEHRLVQTLSETIEALKLLKTRGHNTKRWIKGLADPEERHRRLAYSRLGEIGGEKSAAALAAAFGEAADKDGVEILRALGGIDTPVSTDLLRRVLLDPEFDTVDKRLQREMAGWSARRIGGAAMLDLLTRAIERRHGREAKLLVYAALIGGEQALPLLRAHRRDRMRYIGWYNAQELYKLDLISQRLVTGMTIHSYDLPPDLLSLR